MHAPAQHVHGHALEAHAAASVGRGAESERLNIRGDCSGLYAFADGVGGQHVRIVNALGAGAYFFASHVDIVAENTSWRNGTKTKQDPRSGL